MFKKIILGIASALSACVTLFLCYFNYTTVSFNGKFIGFSPLTLLNNGSVFGTIINLFGIVILASGFIYMALTGYSIISKTRIPNKWNFIVSLSFTGVALISLILSFVFGVYSSIDWIIAELPAEYALGVYLYYREYQHIRA